MVEYPTSNTGGNGECHSRIDRLQVLFEDLHREVAASGGEGRDSARATELRGRIAELISERAAASTNGGGSTRAPTSDVGISPPPAYEQG